MAGVDDRWLALGEEDPLEPELPICDPHHHHHPERYDLEALRADTARHNIVSTVFVECGAALATERGGALAPIGETEFVERLARQSERDGDRARFDAGIVGFANLLLGEAVDGVLEAHLEASPARFKGIRHSAAWHEGDAIRRSHARPPPHMYTLDRFRKGFACLSRRGLSFDAWQFHTQLDELTNLARAFEDTTIVLNHCGGPLGIGPYEGKRNEVLVAWCESVSRLAECPNVVCKLGGLGMAINGFGWHERERPPTSEELATTIEPYIMHCIEQFGVDRCMFQSNFPADKVSCSYTVVWNAFKRLTSALSMAERAALFHDTAVRAYRL